MKRAQREAGASNKKKPERLGQSIRALLFTIAT